MAAHAFNILSAALASTGLIAPDEASLAILREGTLAGTCEGVPNLVAKTFFILDAGFTLTDLVVPGGAQVANLGEFAGAPTSFIVVKFVYIAIYWLARLALTSVIFPVKSQTTLFWGNTLAATGLRAPQLHIRQAPLLLDTWEAPARWLVP